MSHDNAAQNKLAALAISDPQARSTLAKSLRPLTDKVLEHVKGADAENNLATQALDIALAGFGRDSSFAIGTYYSWHLRRLAAEQTSGGASEAAVNGC